MINQEQIDSELNFWTKTGRGYKEDYYRKMLSWWEQDPSNDLGVLEIGTGPHGGVLPYVDSPRKVGLDPIYDAYQRDGLLTTYPDITYVQGTSQDCPIYGRFGSIVCANCLDHGVANLNGLVHVARLLPPKGLFFLHVHLRKENELNLSHPVSFKNQEIMNALAQLKLQLHSGKVYDHDPVEECKYDTLIGVWMKTS